MNQVYTLIVIHWLADFVLQTNKMAQNKSKSFKWLSVHVAVYGLALLIFGPMYAAINACLHFATDAVTTRLTSYLWQKGDRHNFFIVIGLDQALHMICLVSTLPLAVDWLGVL